MQEFNPKYCFVLAARASKLPIELFMALGIRDARRVHNTVKNFLQSGG